MSVNANAAHEEVYTAIGSDLLLIPATLTLRILGHTVQNIDVLLWNVYMVKEIAPHKVPIALVMGLWKTNVLIHIERHNVLEGDLSPSVHLHEVPVYTKRRRPCWKPQHERPILLMPVYGIYYMLCSPKAHLLVIALNDNSHGNLLCELPNPTKQYHESQRFSTTTPLFLNMKSSPTTPLTNDNG